MYISKKMKKKAQGIISRGVKTRQCMSHVSTKNKTKQEDLHQSTAASTWWCGPRPRFGWVEMAAGLPEGTSYPGHSLHFFAMLPPERLKKGRKQHL